LRRSALGTRQATDQREIDQLYAINSAPIRKLLDAML
jgi:hypothetical protein